MGKERVGNREGGRGKEERTGKERWEKGGRVMGKERAEGGARERKGKRGLVLDICPGRAPSSQLCH